MGTILVVAGIPGDVEIVAASLQFKVQEGYPDPVALADPEVPALSEVVAISCCPVVRAVTRDETVITKGLNS